MATSLPALAARIDAILAHPPVHPCVLLVHTRSADLNNAADWLAAHCGWPRLSIGSRLSERLLPLPARRRSRAVQSIMQELVGDLAPSPLLWVDVDLLFEPSLTIDPLRLMRECSRQAPLVVLWPGEYQSRVLSYAVPEHAHYRAWRQTDLCAGCIIGL